MKRVFRWLSPTRGLVVAIFVTMMATLAAEMTSHFLSRHCSDHWSPIECEASPVRLHLQIDPPQPMIGEMVAIHFGSSQSGYSSIWDIGSSGRVSRLYPAPLPNQPNAVPITALQAQQQGQADAPFGLQVTGPPGAESLYMIWTRKPDLQPQGLRYASLRALRQDWQPAQGLGQDWQIAEKHFWVQAVP